MNIPTTESTTIIGIRNGHIKNSIHTIKMIALIVIPRMKHNITSSIILIISHI